MAGCSLFRRWNARRNNVPGKNSLDRVMQSGKFQAVPCVGDNLFGRDQPRTLALTVECMIIVIDHAS
jgi:hypothetical protein